MEFLADRKNKRSRRVFTNLTFWVFIAILAGILLGYYDPATAVKMEVLGKKFVDLIKLFITPIIFFTIVLGISGMGNLKKVGRIGVKALIYFEIVTTFALLIGIAMASWLQPGKIDKTNLHGMDASNYTSNANSDFNWSSFFFSNLTLQVLLVSILIGILLNFSKHRQKAIDGLNKGSKWVFTGLTYVMYLAPIGA
ncbi:MAG TPA: cation:dicarboxylase symporter family transporter, partial [Bacteroidia bacterium]|nr:cation:dicarboxylase symporter family transporter [Bacteroidia bacterium]